MLTEWLQALNDWEVATVLRRSPTLYPFLNAAHILALGVLVGSILPADLRMLGLFRGVAAGPFLRLLTTVSAIGLAFAIASGFLLFSVKPLDYAVNQAFLAKVSLVALGTVNALIVRFSGGWRMMLATGESSAGLKVGALLSLIIWVAAIASGRWIAFSERHVREISGGVLLVEKNPTRKSLGVRLRFSTSPQGGGQISQMPSTSCQLDWRRRKAGISS
ncbi:MAG: DUF6644 family protein [Propylenella sp.]